MYYTDNQTPKKWNNKNKLLLIGPEQTGVS